MQNKKTRVKRKKSLRLKWCINHVTSVILQHEFPIISAGFLVLSTKFNKYNNLNYILRINNLDQRRTTGIGKCVREKNKKKISIFCLK